jgi:hypothetical protein
MIMKNRRVKICGNDFPVKRQRVGGVIGYFMYNVSTVMDSEVDSVYLGAK